MLKRKSFTIFDSKSTQICKPAGVVIGGEEFSLQEKYLSIGWPNVELISLPVEIGKLTALKHLFLRYNKLTSLPVEIGKLTALTELNLANNQLTSLPSEIGNLVLLKELVLFENQLTSLPPEIGKLSLLNNLWLEKNRLISVPPEIIKITRLKHLGIEGNEVLLNELSHLFDEPTLREVGVLGKRFVKEIAACLLKHFLWKNGWSEPNHYFYPKRVKEAIFTTTMIASMKNGNPRHSEAHFYKLPKEILYEIFGFICKDDNFYEEIN